MARSYLIKPGTTAEDLAEQRAFAQMMLKGATDTSPKAHWAHIPAQMLMGGLGGYEAGEVAGEGIRQKDEAAGLFGEAYEALGGGGAPLGPKVPSIGASAPGETSGLAAPGTGAAGAAGASGLQAPAPLNMSAVVDGIIGGESGGRYDAKNPRSSAAGNGQFIDSTWLDMMNKRRPDLTKGKTREEILALRTDPQQGAALGREMTAGYAESNAEQLRASGLPVTPGSLRLAHFLGPAGARTVMSTGANVPVAEVLSPQVMQANPHLNGMTAGQVRTWADRQMRGRAGNSIAATEPGTTKTASIGADEIGLAGKLYRNEATRPLAAKMLEQRMARANKKPEIVTIELGNGQKVSAQQMPDGSLQRVDTSAITGGGAGGGKLPPNFDDTQKLRKEYQSQTNIKKFDDAIGPYQSMIQSAGMDSATSDIDMVYGLATILDPESVVREGEFATIRAAQSIPDRFKGEIQYLFEGKGRLSPEAREKLMEIASNRLNSYRTQAMRDSDRFGELATEYGMDPGLIRKQFPEIPRFRPGGAAPGAGASGTPASGAGGARGMQGYGSPRPGGVEKLEFGPDGKLQRVK